MAADATTPVAADVPTSRVPSTTASTRLLCLLGHPVAHSRSPQLHSAAIAAAGHDAVYVALDVAPGDLPAAVAGLRAVGFLGANVTLPHKAEALALADDATEEARFVGVANTLFWEGDRLVADNTDATGLRDVLADGCGVGPGDPVTIVGSGGAARAAAVALGRLGAATSVHARRPAAAEAIVDLARQAGGAALDGQPPRVVVNATPLGRHSEPLPDAFMDLGPGQVALDLNYEGGSPFLRSAEAAGGLALDGMGMLIAQAEQAFRRWFGDVPPAGAMASAAGRG